MNSVQLIGRLTRDVDLKYTSSGIPVGNFTLAINRPYTNQQGEREADFINCVIWRKAAENLSSMSRKGSLIGVEGSIQTRNYENQQGQRVYVTEVVVDQFHLLESKAVTESRPRSSDDYQENSSYAQTSYSNNNQYSNNQYANQGQYQSQNQPQQPAQNSDFNQPQTNVGQSFDFSSDPNDTPFAQDGQKIDISQDDLPF